MSGGQVQRVAIARALINNPDIILADEPTGALDSETSVQIMELLKEISKDKLIVMVTHNPELAYEYSNRIIKFKDGKVIDDSNPFEPDDNDRANEKFKAEEARKKAVRPQPVQPTTNDAYYNDWIRNSNIILKEYNQSMSFIEVARELEFVIADIENNV